jgi:hypothetical protein
MKIATFLLALFLAVAPLGRAFADGPADLINEVYAIYLNSNGDGSALADRYKGRFTSKRLGALFDYYDAHASPDEVGALDFDPFVDGQDYELKDFAITPEKVSGDKATIVVKFINFDRLTTLTYRLVREAGAWKIDDIESKAPEYPWVLSKLLRGE